MRVIPSPGRIGSGGTPSGHGTTGNGGGEQTGGCGSVVADFYVSPTGKDTWSGTKDAANSDKTDGPFATIDRARQAVKGMPGGKHVVMIRNGVYYLSAPLTFTSADSGSATTRIQYVNYPCETPTISGGKQVTGWTQSGGVWTAKLNSSSYQNFEGLFYNGGRRYRPRTTVGGYLYNAGPVFVPSFEDNCSIQVGNVWQCFDRFYYTESDIAPSYYGMALGDVEVLDFEKWTMSRMRLKSVDTVNHIAYLTGPTYQESNNQGFIAGHRYLIENVKEDLNQLGQWYLDRCTNPPSCTSSTGTWTLTYIPEADENPAIDQVIVPQLSQLIISTGLQNVVFKGLTFAHDNWIAPATGLGDKQDIPDVSAALSFTGSSFVKLDGCTIAHTEGWGVEFIGTAVSTTTTNNRVMNSLLFDLGAGGVRIGKRSNQKDTEATVAQRNLVQNNLIASGGRVQPSGIGTGVWVGNAHHNTVSHNEVHDFYSGAIDVGALRGITRGIGLAHDNVVSYNLLYDLGQGVTSDMGAVYMATSATFGNKILNNVIHDVVHDWEDIDGYGGHGIYFDQGASNILAQNNLVYRTSAASLFNNLSDRTKDTYPQNNVVDNNIFVTANDRMIQHGGNNPSSLFYTHNIVYFDYSEHGRIQGGPWSCVDVGGSGQPVPCATRFLLDRNLYWNTSGDALVFVTTDSTGNNKIEYTLAQWQALAEDTHSLNLDPMFANPKYPSDDFTLLNGSPATQVGFVPFDASLAGRTDQIFSTPIAAPAFPLQFMDPRTDF